MNAASTQSRIDDQGYGLWLRYRPPSDARLLEAYRAKIAAAAVVGDGATLNAARTELQTGLSGLLARDVPVQQHVDANTNLVVGTRASLPADLVAGVDRELDDAGRDGFVIRSVAAGDPPRIVI